MTNRVNGLGFGLHPYPNTPGNQSINLHAAHVPINSLLQTPPGVRQQTHDSYRIERRSSSSPHSRVFV